jgi:hypothetical protein
MSVAHRILWHSPLAAGMRRFQLRGSSGAAPATAAPARPHNARQLRRFTATAVVAMARPWRPHLDDVDRLSRGEGAKRRGTGNSRIPHRLSAEERPIYDSSKKKVGRAA